MKKILIIVALNAVLFLINTAWADDAAVPTKDALADIRKTDGWKQIKKGEEWKRYGIKGYKPQRCGEKTILVDIGAVKFNIKHDDMRYRLLSNINEELDANEIDCNQKEIKSAFSFIAKGSPDKELTVAAVQAEDLTRGGSKSTYSLWKKYIDKWVKEGSITKLSNGTKKIRWKLAENYLLPTDKAPTANGEPVFFFCTGQSERLYPPDSCQVSYIYPDGNGLRISYRILRNQVSEENYLDCDLSKRRVYEQMKVQDSKDSYSKH